MRGKTTLTIFIVAVLMLLAYGIYQAGLHEIGAPPNSDTAEMLGGKAIGRRLTFRSWSIDYDRIRASADMTIVDIDGIHRGYFYRKGKPVLRLTAKHVTVNTVTKDFTASGPFQIESIGKDRRVFKATSAVWTNFSEQLTFNEPVEIISPDGVVLHVANLSYNVKTGDIHLGKTMGDVQI
jgi:hypothetical protein